MVRRTRGRGRNSRVMSVDLSDVETYTPMEEGLHHLKVSEVEVKEGDAGPYWAWKFVAADKDGPEGSVNHNTSFAKQALFNLKSLLESLEVEIPDSEFDLDADEMIGLEMMGEVVHEVVDTDNGKRTYGRIVDHSPVDKKSTKRSKQNDDPSRSKSQSRKKKTVTEEDIADMSQDELEAVVEEHQLDIDLGDFKTVSKMRAAVIAALVDAEVIEATEEEPEEEDDRPSRRSSSSRSRGSRSKEEPEEEEEDERPSRRTRRSRR